MMSEQQRANMTDRPNITGLVIVPAYNEEANLPAVIGKLEQYVPRDHLLFVNDGSRDGTAAALKSAGVPYLTHPVNLGYKEAMFTGMHYCLAKDFPYAVFFDADGQHRIEDLLLLISTYEQGHADFILGSRFRKQRGPRGGMRLIGNRLFSWITTACSGIRITDVTCGLRLIAREYLPTVLEIPSEDLHAELIVSLARCGARIQEVDIEVEPREQGTSMYHFWKSIFYPAKTLLCLVGGIHHHGPRRNAGT